MARIDAPSQQCAAVKELASLSLSPATRTGLILGVRPIPVERSERLLHFHLRKSLSEYQSRFSRASSGVFRAVVQTSQ